MIKFLMLKAKYKLLLIRLALSNKLDWDKVYNTEDYEDWNYIYTSNVYNGIQFQFGTYMLLNYGVRILNDKGREISTIWGLPFCSIYWVKTIIRLRDVFTLANKSRSNTKDTLLELSDNVFNGKGPKLVIGGHNLGGIVLSKEELNELDNYLKYYKDEYN